MNTIHKVGNGIEDKNQSQTIASFPKCLQGAQDTNSTQKSCEETK